MGLIRGGHGGRNSQCCNVHKGYKLEAGVERVGRRAGEVRRDKDFPHHKNQTYFKRGKKTYCPLLKQLLLYIYGCLAVVQLVNRRIIMCTWFFSGEKSV